MSRRILATSFAVSSSGGGALSVILNSKAKVASRRVQHCWMGQCICTAMRSDHVGNAVLLPECPGRHREDPSADAWERIPHPLCQSRYGSCHVAVHRPRTVSDCAAH